MALDKLIGLAMLAVATAVFAYYTAWVFVLPFIDESNVLNSFFLPRDYAIKLPILLLLIGGLGVGSFIGNVLIKNAQKEKLKKSKKTQ
ncbi:dolichol phosphate-mannose biosynthesis regulatory [Suhomyces tanzawaensis NRRL Y-17324]|uniref:Dolichol phosphate-mannose biosynthesis regulatory protein n=1 Tax=Suhomyces tanzawaensis NRRL Y-17324 TaxID=984487 RepID=A0A1E4SHA7_9ASCO|nr:dolichol phosphate-mannose biosynthesis regulatory [Suhomyces tanzawaensis NRRL Y-17324]ODV78899.1 dolichol phosphate-mannose biosynthesis regulatory [Suhomyces tanzawaensis NRRL Y-17324]